MATPEEERRKRGLLERAIASLQGAGEGAARIAGNTFDSIASPLGEAVKDIRDRFTPTPAGSVEAQAFLDDSEYGPPASLNKLGSAVSTPPVQPVAAGDPMRPSATEEQKPQASVPPKRLGPALRGGRTQSEMWGLPGAEPVDLKGSDPTVEKLEPILRYQSIANPEIASTNLESLGPVVNEIKQNPEVAGASIVGTDSFSKMPGGDLVNHWKDVEDAQEELGSFSNSAGKWWSVLLAAMFPQYGSALNMIGGMKESKYRAARDKYDTAFKSQRTPRHDVRGLGDGWYSMDGEIKQLPLNPKSIESEVRYGRTSTGQDVAVSMPRGSDPYHTVDDVDLPFGMGSAPEKVLTYDSRLWQQKLADEGKSGRIIEGKENQMELERVRAANREHLKMLSIQASRDLAWLRADLRTFAGQASAAAQDELENDVSFMIEQDPVKRKQMFETKATEKAALLKKIQQDEMDRLRGGQPPTPQPQPQSLTGSGGQPLKPNFGPR